MIEEDYALLKKDYSILPKFNELNKEFEISAIEMSEFAARDIRKKIIDKIIDFIEVINSILQPDTSSATSMYECKFLGENEKNKLFKIYKQLMFIQRWSTELNIKTDEKEDINFIITVYTDWKKIKKELLPPITKLKDIWKKETSTKEAVEYMG